MQLTQLFPQFDQLHDKFGSRLLTSIYGAGQINNPEIFLIFMNPTSRNVAASKQWKGIKAPWLGTKNVWKLLSNLGLFRNNEKLLQINKLKPEEWTEELAYDLYREIASESIYITNIAKCTQDNARHLPDSVFKEYMPLMIEEITCIKPKKIIALGNQVNSVLLNKQISVSKYMKDEFELLDIGNSSPVRVFPCYYPVGQGMRNIDKAITRIESILKM